MFSFVNGSGRTFSPILAKFGTGISEVISKAEFVCDKKRKYLARVCDNQISVFLRYVASSKILCKILDYISFVIQIVASFGH